MAELRYPCPGAAGASAQAVYEARRREEIRRDSLARRRDAAWRAEVRAAHPVVGRIVAGARRRPTPVVDPATEAWAAGAVGERAVGAVLERCRGAAVLHDRARPGSAGNLDHVVVARSGVYVIDTKAYAATVELFRYRWWGRTGLLVACRNRDDLLDAARDQARVVGAALSAHGMDSVSGPVVPVLCFVGADWRLPGPYGIADGVVVSSPRGLARLVRRRGPLGREDVAWLAAALDRSLPPRSSDR